MQLVKDIRAQFRGLNKETPEGEMLEIVGACFKANEDHIFGKPNKQYVATELLWYQSQSLNVNDLFDLYGQEVPIWKRISSKDGEINSNYGWCIYSNENGSQFDNCVKHLIDNPETRRATMIYNRPAMHAIYNRNGIEDFLCTMGVHYFIRKKKLHAVVQMRSNDMRRGFLNDYVWQKYVLQQLGKAVDVPTGDMIWQVGSLHCYPDDRKLIR